MTLRYKLPVSFWCALFIFGGAGLPGCDYLFPATICSRYGDGQDIKSTTGNFQFPLGLAVGNENEAHF
jgi:hypothetical protein